MARKKYEQPCVYVGTLQGDVLTLSAEPEGEKTLGDIFGDWGGFYE
jgi:hypothetical protein